MTVKNLKSFESMSLLRRLSSPIAGFALIAAGLVLGSSSFAEEASQNINKTAKPKIPINLSVGLQTGRIIVQEKGVDQTLERSTDFLAKASYNILDQANLVVGQSYSYYPDAENSALDPGQQWGDTTASLSRGLIKASETQHFGLGLALGAVKYRSFAMRDANASAGLSIPLSYKPAAWFAFSVIPNARKFFPKTTFKTLDPDDGGGAPNFSESITESMVIGPFYKTSFSSSFSSGRLVSFEGREDSYSYSWSNGLSYDMSDVLSLSADITTANSQLENDHLRVKKPFDYQVTTGSIGFKYMVF